MNLMMCVTVITPDHFFIGISVKSIPEADVINEKLTIREILNLPVLYLPDLYQSFWKRLSIDYLIHLQQRSKWCKNFENLETNNLILVKEDNLPPLK